MRGDDSGSDGTVSREASTRLRGEVQVGGRGRLNVVIPKGVWNCREEWVNKMFRVSPTE